MNGSFVEDTMQRAQRKPNDIDIVTFLQLPDDKTQAQLFDYDPSLFDPMKSKALYGVDAYAVVLDSGDLPYLVRRSVYWNSLWSHDRNYLWKGYLEIDLASDEDAAARTALAAAASQEAEG